MQVGVLQDGSIHQVLEPGLKVTVQEGLHEHAFVLLEDDIAVPFEDDAVLRQGAGLVGAQDVHGPEVLDGIELLDDHLVA
jgi:hypothetical protein